MASAKTIETREQELKQRYEVEQQALSALNPSKDVLASLSAEQIAEMKQVFLAKKAEVTKIANERDEMHRLSQHRLFKFNARQDRSREDYNDVIRYNYYRTYEPLASEAEIDAHNDTFFAQFNIDPAAEPVDSEIGRYWQARQMPESEAPRDELLALFGINNPDLCYRCQSAAKERGDYCESCAQQIDAEFAEREAEIRADDEAAGAAFNEARNAGKSLDEQYAAYAEVKASHRGGARPGAGRKPTPDAFDQRSYQAGYQAGRRGPRDARPPRTKEAERQALQALQAACVAAEEAALQKEQRETLTISLYPGWTAEEKLQEIESQAQGLAERLGLVQVYWLEYSPFGMDRVKIISDKDYASAVQGGYRYERVTVGPLLADYPSYEALATRVARLYH